MPNGMVIGGVAICIGCCIGGILATMRGAIDWNEPVGGGKTIDPGIAGGGPATPKDP